MNSACSVKVGKVLMISYVRKPSQPFSLLCCYQWFGLVGIQLGHPVSDVMYICASITM